MNNQKQKLFFLSQKTKDISFRVHYLKKLRKVIYTYEKNILAALRNDLHKPPFESFISEYYFVLKELDYTIKNVKKWTRCRQVPTPLHLFPSSSFIHPEPYGVVLILAPWNFPFQLILTPLIGVLAAGNCATIKPSEYASHTAHIIHQIIKDTFNEQYVNVVQGDAKVAEQLINEPWDYIFFTGSTHVGKKVMHAAANKLTPLTLELGGKNPCIIDKSAYLSTAAKRIAWGKWYNAGQNCLAPDYLLIHNSIKDHFISLLITAIKKFYGINPQHSNDYGRIINNHHIKRLVQLMHNGTVIHGGRIDTQDKFIEPTIIDHVSLHDPIMQEEIFGPILPIFTINDSQEVYEIISSCPKSLALYVFSTDRCIQQQYANHTFSGSVCINDVLIQGVSSYLPFGGIGNSGFGAYHGKYSFQTFTHYKAIMKTSTWIPQILRYPPYGISHTIISWILKKLRL